MPKINRERKKKVCFFNKHFDLLASMKHRKAYRAEELASLAKQMRESARKSKAQVARDFNVNRATIQQAEEMPQLSLTKLRIRLIEAHSTFTVVGPFYFLKKKGFRNGKRIKRKE